MEKMKKDLPEDVHYNYGFDNTKFIRASIDEVKQTVYEEMCIRDNIITSGTLQLRTGLPVTLDNIN